MSRQLLFATVILTTAILWLPANSALAELPKSVQAGDAKLALNGSGARTKYLMQMYVAGLYLARPSAEPAAIIAADAPMAIRLEITSGFVTQEKLVESLNEGFDKATGGKVDSIRKEIEQFANASPLRSKRETSSTSRTCRRRAWSSPKTASSRASSRGSRSSKPYSASGCPRTRPTRT